jgi:hypothetical protein
MMHKRTGSSSARPANITAACTMAIALMGSNLAQAVNHAPDRCRNTWSTAMGVS